jgi:DNA repair ATPase RecN
MLLPLVGYSQFTPEEINGIVHLIHDLEACKEYTDSLKSRLDKSEMLNVKYQSNVNEYRQILVVLDERDKDLVVSNEKLEQEKAKLKKNRKFYFGSGVLVGLLLLFLV